MKYTSQIEMTETIIVRNLPEEFTGSYEAKGVFNIEKISFQKKLMTIKHSISHNRSFNLKDL